MASIDPIFGRHGAPSNSTGPSTEQDMPAWPTDPQLVAGQQRLADLLQQVSDSNSAAPGCLAAGDLLSCTGPRGLEVTVPAPPDYPARQSAGDADFHVYSKPVGPVRLSPSALMQGVIEHPTPGPRGLVRPAAPEGTLNEATPEIPFGITAGAVAHGFLGPFASPFPGLTEALVPPLINPVKSYVTADQNGNPMVVNVTQTGHALSPGVVLRSVSGSPDGSTIQNEGLGTSRLQGPSTARWLSDWINDAWIRQSQGIIEDVRRRSNQ